jgi:hypothetical protein
MARALEEMEEIQQGSRPPLPAPRLRLVAGSSPERFLASFQMRTCAKCGAHTWFLVEPQGAWSSCTECGRDA